MVAEGRVSLRLLIGRAAQDHTLVHQHVLTDFGRLADDHAHAVIDEEAPADFRSGMNLNAG